jgi:hypothetical protein
MSHTTLETIDLDLEHEALRQEVADWRVWWRELRELGQPRYDEMGSRLRQFRGHLLRHFRHEETAGPLAEGASEPTPNGYRVRQLFGEHDQVLAQLDRLITQLNAGDCFASWEAARGGFESILEVLHAHDASEHWLLDEIKSPSIA